MRERENVRQGGEANTPAWWLNLIFAVIVDRAVQARENDEDQRIMEKRQAKLKWYHSTTQITLQGEKQIAWYIHAFVRLEYKERLKYAKALAKEDTSSWKNRTDITKPSNMKFRQCKSMAVVEESDGSCSSDD